MNIQFYFVLYFFPVLFNGLSKAEVTNLALNKPASQLNTYLHTSVTDGHLWSADKAVDGCVLGDPENVNNCCSMSLAGTNNFWQVDLGQEYAIGRVVIYGRTDGNAKLESFDVYLLDDKGSRYLIQRVGDSTYPIDGVYDIPFKQNVTASSVRLERNDGIISLCEVQVFEGCPDGYYGASCTMPCGHCKNGQVCFKDSGHCPAGCADGWQGTNCDLPCPEGRFGSICKEVCGNCLNNEPCDKETGYCLNGCKEGWYGNLCMITNNVAYKKPATQLATYEDNANGFSWSADRAVDGCISGSSPETQQCCSGSRPIPARTNYWQVDLGQVYKIQRVLVYGRTEDKENNKYASQLSGFNMYVISTENGFQSSLVYNDSGKPYPSDGKIVVELKPPIPGSSVRISRTTQNAFIVLCEVEVYEAIECPDGYYGYECNDMCGNCLNGDLCQADDGRCTSGCAPGYTGDLCQDRCPNGFHGLDCKDTCGNCLNGEICQPDGQCSSGCAPGFGGELCKDACQNGFYGIDCSNACGSCYGDTTCDRFTGVCKDGCNFGWLGDTCKQAVNRARSRDASQLTPFDDSTLGFIWFANKSVDGRFDSVEYCSASLGVAGNTDNFWQVDLGEELTIARLVIYGRPAGDAQASDQLSGFETYVVRSNGTRQLAYNDSETFPIDSRFQIDLRPALIGQYVRIERPRNNNVITLCEVEVYEACSAGNFGEGCNSTCGECLDGVTCDQFTGACPAGCAAGWQGTNCDANCNNGSFGLNCGNTCGSCRDGAFCEPVNGSCPSGCAPGYQGVTCLEECAGGTYGSGCNMTCGNCLNNETCDPVTGSCSSLCAAGYQGDTCVDECDHPRFGINCTSVCNCAANATCNIVNGTCPGNCSAGWEGTSCDMACQNNTYGADCSSSCGNCLDGEACDVISGICNNGCNPGWQGNMCLESCGSGFYGSNCTGVCGNCANNMTCNGVTGNCPGDCSPGWQGAMCNQECADGRFGSNCAMSCYCADKAACNKVTGVCPNGCDEGYSGQFCQNDQNLARSKPTNQSSTLNNSGFLWNASLAVDGMTDAEDPSSSQTCSGTDPTSPDAPWWYVNMESPSVIDYILVYGPTNMASAPITLENFVLYTTNSSSAPTGMPDYNSTGMDVVNGVYNVTFTGSVTAQYIFIMLPTTGALGMCEVRIFGACPDFLYGSDCENTCGSCKDGVPCNKETGVCPAGCAAGYNGTLCKDVCPAGSFGEDCQEVCGKCINGEACERETGVCTNGCAPGWLEANCSITCNDGFYGTDCLNTCGMCKDGIACNKETGACDNGCEPGIAGTLCNGTCQEGSYGEDCAMTCGSCINGTACDNVNGTCDLGCSDGWLGVLCQTACDDGLYGADCNNTCGNCIDNEACLKDSGECSNGCAAGYRGTMCSDVCVSGTYGENCATTCGNCVNDTVCNIMTGECPSGCDDGLTPPLCASSASQQGGTSDDDDNVPAIVGGVIGGVAFIVIIVLIVYVIQRKKRHGRSMKGSTYFETSTNRMLREQEYGYANQGYTTPTYDSLNTKL